LFADLGNKKNGKWKRGGRAHCEHDMREGRKENKERWAEVIMCLKGRLLYWFTQSTLGGGGRREEEGWTRHTAGKEKRREKNRIKGMRWERRELEEGKRRYKVGYGIHTGGKDGDIFS
jgi:hypothetical protein